MTSRPKAKAVLIGHGYPRGKGLWMSIVLRPNVPFDMITKFNLFMALGIRDVIQAFSEAQFLLNGRMIFILIIKKFVVFNRNGSQQ